MQQVNQTPFAFACIAGRVKFPAHSLTLVVKGTFDLAPSGIPTASKKQVFPTADEFYPADEERTGSSRYESDFAYFKHHADLLLVGKCHSPAGKPVEACKVTFRVGSRERTLMVVGDRAWQGMLGRAVSAPAPFVEMPLVYERTFGGPGYKKNPVGKGFAKVEADSGKSVRLLPNIEDPEALIDSPSDRPDPAGFGPLNKNWETRQKCLGTYKGDWLKKRWPWFPEDFDWAYFNAAPPPMRLDGYLVGDEELYFENLHPKQAQYRSSLPGLRARCFLSKQEGLNPSQFEEINLNMDTLWVDMEAEKLVLVWRGVANVLSEEFAEVKHALIVSEPLQSQPLSAAHYRALLDQKLAEANAEFTPEEPVEIAPLSKPQGASSSGGLPRGEAIPAAESTAAFDAMLKERGIEPSFLESYTKNSPQAQAHIQKQLQELDAGGFDAYVAKTTKDLAETFKAKGVDLNNPPALTDEAKKRLATALKDLGLGDEASVEAAYLEGFAAMRNAFADLGLIPKTAGETVATESAPESAASPPNPQLSPVDKAKELLSGEKPLAGEDLSGLDFSSLDLKGKDFSGAILRGSIFRNANLCEANLEGVSAPKADFTGAKLKGAKLVEGDFTEARFSGADLTGADFSEATFHKATLEKALIDEGQGKGAVFSEGNLSGARFQKAKLDDANFANAQLAYANFRKASLKAATLQRAIAPRANFSEADLTGLRASLGADFTEASFQQALGPGSTWKEAKLQKADFSYAQMEGADFASCIMDDANLYAADMKSARFARASLRRAKLVQMNLFEGSLEKADLSNADLSGANMYAVEFLDAKFAQTTIRDANLKMTKMAQS